MISCGAPLSTFLNIRFVDIFQFSFNTLIHINNLWFVLSHEIIMLIPKQKCILHDSYTAKIERDEILMWHREKHNRENWTPTLLNTVVLYYCVIVYENIMLYSYHGNESRRFSYEWNGRVFRKFTFKSTGKLSSIIAGRSQHYDVFPSFVIFKNYLSYIYHATGISSQTWTKN